MIKSSVHVIKGMQRDLTVSKFNPEFAFDAQNIRITARENNSLLSITNEKGNNEIILKDKNNSVVTLQGTVIGYNVLNNYLTLFTTDNTVDRIYRLERKGSYFECIVLYQGSLGFKTSNPIESIGVYENENIQKVYWIDGKNQARVINIVAPDEVKQGWNNGSFDFVQNIKLNESITITRNVSGGFFASGVIQYAFTYYNMYGQESNIFYTSPINYISFKDRGASPEEKTSNSFTIKISNADTNFDFIRIYSIHRTSIDATPTVVNVVDLPIDGKDIIYVDTGGSGVTIDPTELLYIGGESIVPQTMTSKDNTLFLGNIRLQNKAAKTLSTSLKNKDIWFSTRNIEYSNDLHGYYSYNSHLGNPDIRGFKYLDWYRFGIQFQRSNGRWSEAIFIKDAQNINQKPSPINVVQAYIDLPQGIINEAVNEGFIRARGVVVFPTINDREVIAQGIVCPTVYNMEDRCSNSPFAQASWFTRPNIGVDDTMNKLLVDTWNKTWYNYNHNYDGSYYDIVNQGAWAEFRHNHPIPNNWARNAEIQCLANVPDTPYTTDIADNTLPSWISKNKEYFFIDQSIITLHSPEIEFDDDIANLDLSDVKLRIVGRAVYTANASDIDIQTTTPQNNVDMPGVYKEAVGVENTSQNGAKSLISGLYYYDEVHNHNSKMPVKYAAFMVYPWHRNGSLNNDTIPTGDTTRTAVLSKKKMSNLKFAGYTEYLNSVWYALGSDEVHTGISGAVLFNSEDKTLVKIKAPSNSGLNDITYYGNLDRVITPTRNDDEGDYTYSAYSGAGFENGYTDVVKQVPLNRKNGYPIVAGTDYENIKANKADNLNMHKYFVSTPVPIMCLQDSDGDKIVANEKDGYGTDPVRIKYKSSPHIVIAFNYTKEKKDNKPDYKQVILPTLRTPGGYIQGHTINDANYTLKRSDPSSSEYMPWDTECKGVFQDTITIDEDLLYPYYGYSWIAELYRDKDDVVNRFGGTSDSAIESNLWLPAGEPVSLISGYDSNGSPIPVTVTVENPLRVNYTEGDTYFQRYDCLKTYPYTLEDQNSIVEIASFYCETRVNIDGRYDRNRGQISNLSITPTNFNLINPIYSQKNNFFSSRALNYNKYSLDYFPNTITWTKEKQAGAIVDTWTNITMASTLDLDGDKGEVVSLNTFNNEVFCFQKQGFSNILFNSRVQIPTSDGMPIEISNGLKVNGKRYISNTIGCNNKWSIAESPSGLYFIDNITNSIYLFNGQISSLSDKLGFRQWVGENNSLDNWDPVEFKNFVTYYDKNNDDVYFVNKDTALVYSELLGQFTSFMSYGQVPGMFNIDSDFYAIKNGIIWEQFAGDYNKIFNEYCPYSVTFISNADEPYDKIFNTVEFRADCWTKDGLLASGHTFDTLEVWNEYQKGVSSLTCLKSRPSPLKKKFRVWRANVPRANTDWNGVPAENKMDRIRNTWAYVKLSMNKENTDRMEFHDMIVHYFV